MSAERETELLDRVPDGLFIGGSWRGAENGATLTVADPATGDVVKTIASASVADGIAAHASCAARSTCCRSARRTSPCS